MNEKNSGVHSLLQSPFFYNLLQNTLGANKLRRYLTREVLDLRAGLSILDLGCGPCEILEHLPESVSYYGVDYNQDYIKQARSKYGNRGTFSCEDLTKLENLNKKFDRVMILGFLHHLDDVSAESLLTQVSKLVAPGGFLMALENVRVENQNSIARYLINKDRGQHVRTAEAYKKLFKSFGKIETLIRHDLLRLPYSHVIFKAYVN